MHSTAHMSSQQSQVQRRRFPRYSLQVPLDLMTLRSGIPFTIPGRSLDVGEGGLAAVIAGELRPGESVGVELRLPFTAEPIQAKAVVRHHGFLRCGLEFLSMPPEQYGTLHTWAVITGSSQQTQKVEVSPVERIRNPAIGHETNKQPSAPLRRSRSPRHKLLGLVLAGLVVIVAAAFAWWSWPSVLHPSEKNISEQDAWSTSRLKVPSSTMERNLLHRVEPTYPQEALESKLEGVVLLDTIVGQDGAVKQVRPIMGSDVLARSAMEAVKWWRFQPYQVNGQPLEVETTVEVDFRLKE